MLKTVFIAIAATFILTPVAQAQNEDHSGHNHGKQTQTYNGPLSAAPDVEHIYTEAPDDQVIGAENAPTTIIAYASVTCPHCSKWFIEEWPTFKKNQIDTGNVRFILREFPTPPQNLAMIGFTIANCATAESYMDNVVHQMQAQKAILAGANEGRGEQVYDALAARAGLKNRDTINACFNDRTHNDKINRAISRARAGNIQSVPSFFIDGVQFAGEATAVRLDTYIKRKLKTGVSMPSREVPKTSK